MSRIGLQPIPLPDKVQVALNESDVQVEGPKGSLNWILPDGIDVTLEENVLTVQRQSELKQYKALHGLARSLIANWLPVFQKALRKNYESWAPATGLKLTVIKIWFLMSATHTPSLTPHLRGSR